MMKLDPRNLRKHETALGTIAQQQQTIARQKEIIRATRVRCMAARSVIKQALDLITVHGKGFSDA